MGLFLGGYMEYVRFCTDVNIYKLIPASQDAYELISDYDKDHYISIFRYNDKHYEMWKEKKTVAGIRDVTTSKLYFDLDSKQDLEIARLDAVTLVKRLSGEGIAVDSIKIAFTGKKGFSVEVDTNKTLTQEEFKNITFALAEDLSSFDRVVNDPQRIVRMAGTKHKDSGLYKLPLSAEELTSLSVSDIKERAKDFSNVEKAFSKLAPNYDVVNLPDSIYKFKTPTNVPKKDSITSMVHDLDLKLKPKWLSDAKYALQEGYFEATERHTAFLILAATYRGQGFNRVTAYHMLKGAAELQAARTNQERFSNDELWNNIIKSVYSDNWNKGTYSYDNTPLLQDVTKRLNLKPPKEENDAPRFLTNVTHRFKDYVKNIEKNTIKTGIPALDQAIFLSTGANVGLLGAPGSGKSSLALEILSNTSKAGVKSVFASLDMTSTRIYEKILYRLTGKTREEIYKLFKEDKEAELVKKIDEEFGNVFFFDKSSPTVESIREYVEQCNARAATPEDKVKLVMIDYFERVSSDVSDDTAASKKVAGQLQDLVNDLDICLITLVQPNKMSGDMSEPIYSYTNIKGSSFLAQSFRIIMGVYREGYNPKVPENDKFLTINVLKNDLGEPCSLDFAWNGKRGRISDAGDEELAELEEIRKRKAMAAATEGL